MADIRDFAKRGADLYGVHQETLRANSELYRTQGGLPATRKAASEFIKAAYNASLIPDEGRYPVTCLMCYREDVALQFHTLFDEPCESTAEEIAKLSHAIDNRSHIACICEKDRITLGGFHVNMLYNQREYGYFSGRIANPLKVRIKGPGYIEVACTGAALVFRGGHISEESPLTLSGSMNRLVARVTKELRKTIHYPIESLDHIVNDLMREIVRLGHGGMLIFADTPKASHFSSLRRTNCYYFQELLCNYWDESAKLVKAAGGVGNLLKTPNRSHLTPYMMDVTRATDQLENCLPAIANLSGMDGAIVLTYGCNVGAFNAIIDRQKKPKSQAKLIGVDGRAIAYEKTFAHRGSRHQSGLLYARSVPDSFVFVVSQDGSISAFHNPNDGTVICEFGLRPME
jgi:Probable sensor domain DACNV